MAEGPSGDRTEKATPKRRREARDRGQVARSQEMNGALVLIAGCSMLLLGAGWLVQNLRANASYLFGQAHLLRVDNLGGLRDVLVGNLEVFGRSMALQVTVVLLVALAVNVAQVGFHVSSQALAFKPERLNFFNGLKRFFSKKTLFELVKNLVKVGLLAFIAFTTIRGLMGGLLAAPLVSLPGTTDLGKMAFAELMAKLLALLAILAIVDWVFQKRQHEESIKMTKTEVKQEFKDLEGDPQIKARMRAIQLETARQRMLADVQGADVVITNPDHLAVALKYDRQEPAPRVVAKGREELAAKIKKIARTARVPVIENKPVARALFAAVKVGDMVPESLYQVVAEVLAYVYRLRRS